MKHGDFPIIFLYVYQRVSLTPDLLSPISAYIPIIIHLLPIVFTNSMAHLSTTLWLFNITIEIAIELVDLCGFTH